MAILAPSDSELLLAGSVACVYAYLNTEILLLDAAWNKNAPKLVRFWDEVCGQIHKLVAFEVRDSFNIRNFRLVKNC